MPVRIAVRDNGCGMSSEVLERAFEPFYSARGSRATRGVGLGLSISHAIIEGHGGKIRAESAGSGQGSQITVELPLHREGADDRS
jgi:signal transduction histidine kinase